MENILTMISIASVILVFAIFYSMIKKARSKDEDASTDFSTCNEIDCQEAIKQVSRDHVAHREKQDGIGVAIMKSAPRMIMRAIILLTITHFLAGYFTLKNSERLASAGSALSQGDYGSAIVSLFTIAKPALLEQSRIARGNHPYLEENKLLNFTYIGKNKAIMTRPYSFQDHDEDVGKDSEDYGKFLLGIPVSKAIDIAEDRYEKHNGKLMSIEEWNMNRSHFLGAGRIDLFPKIPEWTRNFHKSDTDDYLIIAKESGVKEWAGEEDIDREEDGLYIDGDEVPAAAFRISITWENDASTDN